jgi:hypothetical protein
LISDDQQPEKRAFARRLMIARKWNFQASDELRFKAQRGLQAMVCGP